MRHLLFFSSIWVLFVCFSACEKRSRQAENTPQDSTAQQALLEEGYQLSQQYCVSCHAYPEPELLDKSTWRQYVLPRMGYMLGIYPNEAERQSLLEPGDGGKVVEAANVFPQEQIIDRKKWQKIFNYYLEKAPRELTSQALPIEKGLKHFKVRQSSYRLSPPSTTLVSLRENDLFVGDANSKAFYVFDQNLELKNAANVKEGAVWLQEDPNRFRVTVMGSFSPTDTPSGLIIQLPKNTQSRPKVILGDLQRPVHTEYGDLNGDGREDILTCEFAKWTGGLAWWEHLGGDAYRKHNLRAKPGATKAYIRDLNQDERPDIIALFGQGDEGIFIYYNEGEGKFREERVLQFPSVYGSSFFELFDYNGDSFPDIIYTNGDNADYPAITKPYHGIRIFVNDGKNAFEEVLFYPLHGAYKAIPADFDLDGDLDIAAISFFPDYDQRPEEGFVYLENQGREEFKAFTFPEVTEGRWIALDAADWGGDGDLDLILGSLTFEVRGKPEWTKRWQESGLPFVVLENTTK